MTEAILAVIGSLQVGGFALMWYRLGKLEQAMNSHQKANEEDHKLLERLKTVCPLCTVREDR